MDILKRGCIYCEFVPMDGGVGEEPHIYADCAAVAASPASYMRYKIWRVKVDFGKEFRHRFDCGLSQEMCQKPQTRVPCAYMDMMLPGIYTLDEMGFLSSIVEGIGFHGEYPDIVWDWMREDGEGFGLVRESNWMQTWRHICEIYMRIRQDYRRK